MLQGHRKMFVGESCNDRNGYQVGPLPWLVGVAVPTQHRQAPPQGPCRVCAQQCNRGHALGRSQEDLRMRMECLKDTVRSWLCQRNACAVTTSWGGWGGRPPDMSPARPCAGITMLMLRFASSFHICRRVPEWLDDALCMWKAARSTNQHSARAGPKITTLLILPFSVWQGFGGPHLAINMAGV